MLDPNAGRPARQSQWSVGIQREITRDLVVEASYVGNRGVWWQAPGLLNLNANTPERLSAFGLDVNNAGDRTLLTSAMNTAAVVARGFKAPYAGFPSNQTLAQALRPFPQFTTLPVYWNPMGKTWYDALQLKVTQRFSRGLSGTANFSWSKAETIGTEIGEPNPGTTGNAVFIDGVPVTGANSVMPLKAGKIAGLAELRDNATVTYQNQLDEIARGLIAVFAESDQSATPTLPDVPGLFTYPGAPALPASATVSV